LVEALKMGEIQDEAQAESMLSTSGIEPKNGWIAGYPVTPPVIGDIEKGLAGAADAGNLRVTKDEALKALGELKRNLGLNVSSGAAVAMAPQSSYGNTVIYKYIDKNGVIYYTDRYESIPKEYRNQTKRVRNVFQPRPSVEETVQDNEAPAVNAVANANPEVINNYYYNEGPPVVTYYPPPDPYAYLYSWVPYPFRYSGLFFSGYFILHDFHRRIYYGRNLYAITNHVPSAVGKRMAVVDPVSRSLRGSMGATPVTFLPGFRSPTVQANAGAILGINQNRMAHAGGTSAPKMSSENPSASLNRPQGQVRAATAANKAVSNPHVIMPASPAAKGF
jgi:hypothetical protein